MAHLPSSLKVNPRFTPSSKDSNSKASVSRAVIQKAHLNVGDVLRVHTGSTLNHSEEWNYGQGLLLVTQTKKSAPNFKAIWKATTESVDASAASYSNPEDIDFNFFLNGHLEISRSTEDYNAFPSEKSNLIRFPSQDEIDTSGRTYWIQSNAYIQDWEGKGKIDGLNPLTLLWQKDAQDPNSVITEILNPGTFNASEFHIYYETHNGKQVDIIDGVEIISSQPNPEYLKRNRTKKRDRTPLTGKNTPNKTPSLRAKKKTFYTYYTPYILKSYKIH